MARQFPTHLKEKRVRVEAGAGRQERRGHSGLLPGRASRGARGGAGREGSRAGAAGEAGARAVGDLGNLHRAAERDTGPGVKNPPCAVAGGRRGQAGLTFERHHPPVRTQASHFPFPVSFYVEGR